MLGEEDCDTLHDSQLDGELLGTLGDEADEVFADTVAQTMAPMDIAASMAGWRGIGYCHDDFAFADTLVDADVDMADLIGDPRAVSSGRFSRVRSRGRRGALVRRSAPKLACGLGSARNEVQQVRIFMRKPIRGVPGRKSTSSRKHAPVGPNFAQTRAPCSNFGADLGATLPPDSGRSPATLRFRGAEQS